jgi:antitoxin component YwqK of YwqJK toxin-antitoxin module
MKKNQFNKEGEREGYWEFYYDNGKLDYIRNFKNGIQDGYTEGYYYTNGNLAYKGYLIDEEVVGYWEHYSLNGLVEFKEYYFVD